jgi:hypothetical protein
MEFGDIWMNEKVVVTVWVVSSIYRNFFGNLIM